MQLKLSRNGMTRLGIVLNLLLWYGTNANNEPKNAREFNSLCRLLLLAERLANSETSKYLGELPNWEDFREEIESTKKVLLVETYSNASERSVNTGANHEHLSDPVPETIKSRLKKSENKLKNLEIKLELAKNETDKKVEQAKTDAWKAITGKDSPNPDLKANIVGGDYNTQQRGTFCAGSESPTCDTSAKAAGCSLIHDLICLCTPGNSGNTYTQYICGVDITQATGTNWNQNTFNRHANLVDHVWNPLEAGCRAGPLPAGQVTAQDLKAELNQFYGLLGAQVSGVTGSNQDKNNWVLGVPHTDGTCDGQRAAVTSVCVNYGVSSSRKLGKIMWVENLKAAAQNLELAEIQRRKAEKIGLQIHSAILGMESILVSANVSLGSKLTTDAANRFSSTNSAKATNTAAATTTHGTITDFVAEIRLTWFPFIITIL